MKKEERVLFVIPAYNEEACILKTVNTILEYNKKNHTNYDVLVINDGSKDNTEEILNKNNINHIKLINNLGIGGAVQTGFKYAYENQYDYAIQYDGDGQHNVSYAKDLLDSLRKDEADMAIGSRFIVKDKNNFNSSAARRVGIKVISFFIKLRTGKKIYDTTSGMRAINSKIIKEFANYYPVEYPEPVSTTLVLKKGYRVSEKYVKMNERETGSSSIKAWKNIYYMVNVILSILFIGTGGKK